MAEPRAIHTVPASDSLVRAHVDAAAAYLSPGAGPRELEALLHTTFPEAVVHERTEFGGLTDEPTWYVYRDDRITVVHDEWWRNGSLPCVVIDERGEYIDANPEALALLGRSRDMVIGAHAGDFSRHPQLAEPRSTLLEILNRGGTLLSTAVLVRGDGTDLPVDCWFEPLASLPRQWRIVMRPVHPPGSSGNGA